MAAMYQFGWFSTGKDKAARDLLQAVQHQIKLGEIRAEIVFVFCSRELGESAESDMFIRSKILILMERKENSLLQAFIPKITTELQKGTNLNG